MPNECSRKNLTCKSSRNNFCTDFISFFSLEDSPDRRAAGPDALACSEPGPSQPSSDPDASQNAFEDSQLEASEPAKQITAEKESQEADGQAEGDYKGDLDLLNVEARS